MQPLRIMTLDLRSPLRYRLSTGVEAFVAPAEGERIVRFDIEHAVAASVEPAPASYLGAPVLVADSFDADAPSDTARDDAALGIIDGDEIVIPVGRYLFAQLKAEENGEVDAELFAAAAIELQKDGLWRGITLERFLYLRLLVEEGGPVFQILRPIAAAARP